MATTGKTNVAFWKLIEKNRIVAKTTIVHYHPQFQDIPGQHYHILLMRPDHTSPLGVAKMSFFLFIENHTPVPPPTVFETIVILSAISSDLERFPSLYKWCEMLGIDALSPQTQQCWQAVREDVKHFRKFLGQKLYTRFTTQADSTMES